MTVVKRVIDNPFILLNRDRTSGIPTTQGLRCKWSTYTMYPPVLLWASTQSIAAKINSFWRWLSLMTSFWVFWAFICGSREITPRPVQGASRRHLSNLRYIFGNFLPSWHDTTQLNTPNLCMFAFRDFKRSFFTSFATKTPVFFINWAMYDVLPPGAAAMSRTRSFGYGASVITGRKELGLCKM